MKRYEVLSVRHGNHFVAEAVESEVGDYVKFEDVQILKLREKLLCDEISKLMRKLHGHVDYPQAEIPLWVYEYNKLRNKVEDEIKKAGVS